MDTDFVVKYTILWHNRFLRVYLDLFVPDFPKSTSKDFFCMEVVRKYGFRCFAVFFLLFGCYAF